jgi:amino acid permease
VYAASIVRLIADTPQLFPLYNELASNTQARMNALIGSSIGSATLTYEVIGVLGYLTFGSKVGANIIAMYPASSLFIAVGQLAIVVLVLVSYPLQVHPCRNCLDKVFGAGHAQHKALPTSEAEADAQAQAADEHGPAGEMSAAKHALLTAAIIVPGFALAYFVDDLRMGASGGRARRPRN